MNNFSVPFVVPGLPFVRRLCSTIVWQVPTEQNGEIDGYDVRFNFSPSSSQTLRFSPSDNFFLTEEEHRGASVTVEVYLNTHGH